MQRLQKRHPYYYKKVIPVFEKILTLRLAVSICIGVVSIFLSHAMNPTVNEYDMGWSFVAAHNLIDHINPYANSTASIVPYPLTAAIIAFPLALLPNNSGAYLLFGFSSGLLAYGVLRDKKYWKLLLFISPSFLMNLSLMQWAPLLISITFFPVLFPALLIKPTMAPPIVMETKWTLWGVLASIFIVLLSLYVMWDWPLQWIKQLGRYDGFIPVAKVLGPLFLLCLFLLHNKQARLFIALIFMPQHYFYYDQLWVSLIPQSGMQMLTLTITSWIAFLLTVRLPNPSVTWTQVPYIMTLIYLPAFVMILWQEGVFQKIHGKLPVFFFRKNNT